MGMTVCSADVSEAVGMAALATIRCQRQALPAATFIDSHISAITVTGTTAKRSKEAEAVAVKAYKRRVLSRAATTATERPSVFRLMAIVSGGVASTCRRDRKGRFTENKAVLREHENTEVSEKTLTLFERLGLVSSGLLPLKTHASSHCTASFDGLSEALACISRWEAIARCIG